MQSAPGPVELPAEFYAARIEQRRADLQRVQREVRVVGFLRLLSFLLSAVCVWLCARGTLALWSIAVPVVGFIALLYRHSSLDRASNGAARAVRFYERGLARVEHRREGWAGDGGERFADPHHPYSGDLDIFERGNLFDLLSTARTRGGEQRLADWLCKTASAEELAARHDAVRELVPLTDLREQLAVSGEDVRAQVNPEALRGWATGPARPLPTAMRALALAISGLLFAVFVWFLATNLEGENARIAFIATGFVGIAFSVPLRRRVLNAVNGADERARELEVLAGILSVVEHQEFHSVALRRIVAAVETDGTPASAKVRRLRRIGDMIESRDNPFVRGLGPLVLWTTQLGMAVEAWRAQFGAQVPVWLDAVAELEALCSLAGYAWENPRTVFPEIVRADGATFIAEGLEHPLLAPAECVSNDVALQPPLRLLIVSGSNMSGKSTLLRTVGVAVVMAMAGAPVRAKRLVISPLSTGASIRATDSLEEGRSRFMAEILRLRQILELPQPALFLLDELLAGTNSHDRVTGAEGLLRALIERGGIGLVSTHDLSLARITDSLAPAASNVHFEDRLEDGHLVFDYRLRPGVVTRSNALDLMRSIGLDV